MPELAKQEELENSGVQGGLNNLLGVFRAEFLRGTHSHFEDRLHGSMLSDSNFNLETLIDSNSVKKYAIF